MAVLTTGQSFADGDQVTAQKLEDIANQATFRTGANNTADASTIEVDSSGGYLKVPSGGISSNELKSDASVDANRAVTTNHIRDDAIVTAKIKNSTDASDGVTLGKIQFLANLKVIGNVSGSLAVPAEITINDTDSMSDASATTLATSESIKAYVDSVGNNVFAKGVIDASTGAVGRGTNISNASASGVGTAYQTFVITLSSGPASGHADYNVQIATRVSTISGDTAQQIVYKWDSSTQITVQVSGGYADAISFLIIQ